MACKTTGKKYCVWIKYKDGFILNRWICFDCGRRRRAKR